MADINKALQTVVGRQLGATGLTDYTIGTVSKESPLEIKINERITLPNSMILLTEVVIEKKLNLSHFHEVQDSTEIEDNHKHNISLDTKTSTDTTITIQEGLKEGEKVLLLSVAAGQKFVVISKLRNANKVTIDKENNWVWG